MNWIKVRTSLLQDTRINSMARMIEADPRSASTVLKTSDGVTLDRHVTRHVTRSLVVTACFTLWSQSILQTSDGVFKNCSTEDIDDLCGLPGFADSMISVGWLMQNLAENSISIPEFESHNSSQKPRTGEPGAAMSDAERAKRYRERQREAKKTDEPPQESDEDSNRHVTSRDESRDSSRHDTTEEKREEEKREDSKEPPKPPKAGGGEVDVLPAGFVRFWAAYPKCSRKGGKSECLKAWKKSGLEAAADQIVEHLGWMSKSVGWVKDGGEFISAPLTYLNKRSWDGAERPTAAPAGIQLAAPAGAPMSKQEALEQRNMAAAFGLTPGQTTPRVTKTVEMMQ